jgi:hypothetical protein
MLSDKEIRVLDLHPSPSNNDQAELECQTRIVPLSDNPEYEALSYVWGDGPDTTEINVDGKRASITQSLAAALRRIRLPSTTRTLWVDQLCINQDDVEEKALQVPLMGQLYSKTTQCLIWFGEINSQFSLSAAQSALDVIRFIYGYKKDGTWEGWPPPPVLASDEALEEPMQALKSISMGPNPWWRRVWTLQEAILPSKGLVLWGPLSIPWGVIVTAGFLHLRNYMPELDHVSHSHRKVIGGLFSHTIGLQWAKEATNGPLDTAFRWNFRDATNPLDKVYALLGLFPLGTLPRVQKCDYRLTPGTLYAMFTADLIQHHRSLHALALRRHEPRSETTPGVPCWALDKGVDYHGMMIKIDGNDAAWYLMHTYSSYSASGELEIDMDKFQYDQDTNALTLTGSLFDTIAVAGPKPQKDTDEPGSTTLSVPGALAKLREWYGMAGQFYQEREWSDALEGPQLWPGSFWRGLLGNYYLNEEYAPERWATDEDLKEVEEFLKTGTKNSACWGVFATLCHRTMFLTTEGRLGFGPTDLAVGDEVWILRGGNVPFVVRRNTDGAAKGYHRYLGPSYLDGVMLGEVVEGREFTTEISLV